MRSPALAVLEAVAQRRRSSPRRGTNIGGAERATTLVAGAALLAWPFRRPSVVSTAAVVGGALVYRGARGRSRLYEAIGVSTARPQRVERVMTINGPPRALHATWRDPGVRTRVMLGAEHMAILTDAAEEMTALTFRMGQTHVHRYMRPLLSRIERGEIDPTAIITHRAALDDAPRLYQAFDAKRDGCVKVVLSP